MVIPPSGALLLCGDTHQCLRARLAQCCVHQRVSHGLGGHRLHAVLVPGWALADGVDELVAVGVQRGGGGTGGAGGANGDEAQRGPPGAPRDGAPGPHLGGARGVTRGSVRVSVRGVSEGVTEGPTRRRSGPAPGGGERGHKGASMRVSEGVTRGVTRSL
eukprot:498762-Prorocentrum_minimum.AAC.1